MKATYRPQRVSLVYRLYLGTYRIQTGSNSDESGTTIGGLCTYHLVHLGQRLLLAEPSGRHCFLSAVWVCVSLMGCPRRTSTDGERYKQAQFP